LTRALNTLFILLISTRAIITYGQTEFPVGKETLVIFPWMAYPVATMEGKSNVVVAEGASWHVFDDVLLEGNLSIYGGMASGFPVTVQVGTLMIDEKADIQLAAGSVIQYGKGTFTESLKAKLTEKEIFLQQFEPLAPPAMLPTCGNGSGQTPFTINASVVTNFNGFQVSCNDSNDGVVTVNISGGIGPFLTTWFGGSGVQSGLSYTQLGAGSYTVLVTDLGQGITCVDNVQVTVPSAVTIFSLTTTPPSCLDVCNGSAVPIAIGGTFNFSYNWSSGETTQNASSLCNGPGSLTITDSNGCSFTQTFNLNVSVVAATLDIQNILCFGTSTGSVTVNPSGGAGGPYTANWSSGGTGLTQNGFSAGSYTVTVTDAAGCEIELPFEITEEPPLQIALTNAINPLCGGDFSGSISVAVSQGTPGYSFSWTGPGGFVSASQNISALQAGTYALTVTDANGCQVDFSQTLTAPDALDLLANAVDISCFGLLDGSIDLTVTGGSGSYSFSWAGPGGFSAGSEDISGLAVGNYSVTVTDSNGCSVDGQFTVSEAPQIVATTALTPINCAGSSTGQITLSITGGTPGYSVSWAGPGGFVSASQNISGLAAGSYTAQITDSNGCHTNITAILTNPSPINASASATPTACFGGSTGSITLSISGGTPGYTVAWTGPGGFVSASQNISELAPGSYSATVTDAAGCFVNLSATVTEPPAIVISGNVSNVTCGGAADGAISLVVSGGVPGYSFAWSGPGGFVSASQNISGLSGGNHSVTVTDASGCQLAQTFTVSENPPLLATVNFTPVTCSGANDGSAVLTIIGGTPGYVVSWTGPGGFVSASQNISGLAPGSYSAIITDAADCTTNATFDLIDPQTFTVDVTTTPVACFGQNNGSVSLDITGGTPGYTVAWTGPGGFVSASQNISGLAPGSYSATVTDAAGCFVNLSATVTEPIELEFLATLNQISCGGAADGALSILITGGVPNYNISWTGPSGFSSSAPSLTNLGPGDYSLLITDAIGCTANGQFTLAQAPLLVLTLTATDISCFGANDGSINLDIAGGVPGYLISWTGPGGFVSTAQNLNGLQAGNYQVQVIDSDGCSAVATAAVIEPIPFTLDNVAVTQLGCANDSNGQIALTISGGAAPITIAWNVGGSANPLTGIGAGTYSAIITDNSGCQLTTGDIVLVNPDEIVIDVTSEDILCFGELTGAISTTISGGTGALVLQWSGPNGFSSSDPNLTGLGAGTYTLVVTDANSCSETTAVTLTEPEELAVSNNITQPFCPGDLGGFALSVSGGTTPYTISWTGPGGFVSNQVTLPDLVAGNYTLLVEDANGCIFSDTYSLDSFTQFDLTAAIVPLDCSNQPVASITLALAGGTEPYVLAWSGPGGFSSDQSAIFDLGEGTYNFTLTDANGCQLDTALVLIQPPLIFVDAQVISAACNGPSSGSISTNISGGIPPYNILWSGPGGFGSISPNIANLGPGDYTLAITDNGQCPFTETYTVTGQPEVNLSLEALFGSCGGSNSGQIDLSITGGSAPYITAWVGPAGFSSAAEDISGLAPGSYSVTVSDANGCVATSNADLIEPEPLSVSINTINPTCGVASGSLEAIISGGSAPFDVVWTSDGIVVGTDVLLENLPGGLYEIQVMDGAGCALTDLAALSDFAGALSALITPVSCNGLADGAVQITITDGNAPFDITWIGPGGFASDNQDIFDLAAGDYGLEVTDADGCVLAEVYAVTEPEALTSAAAITSVSCFGSNDGQVSLEIFGGTDPFTVSWAGPGGFASVDLNLTNLAPGTYTATITDANGCVSGQNAEITENSELDLTFVSSPIVCFEATSDGFIETTVSGGQAPYTFQWTLPDGSTAGFEDLVGIGPGTYTLVVTDANGCSGSSIVNIDEATELGADFAVINPNCLQANGSIDPLPFGGTPGYSFVWTDITSGGPVFVSDQAQVTNLASGLYEVQITDALGCTFTDIVPLSDIDNEVTGNLTSPLCFGGNDGSITVNITGLVDPVVIDWTGPNGFASDSQNISDLQAGIYTIVATDGLGCVATEVFDLTEPDSLAVAADIIGLTCPLAGDGSIAVSIAGGTGPYEILWIGPLFTSDQDTIAGLAEGCYELFITDANGCQLQYIFCVDVEDPIDASALVTDIICAGTPTGIIDLNVTGGAGGYTYAWDGPNGFDSDQENLTDLFAGLYNLVVTDSLGCSGIFAFEVDENPAPLLTADVVDVLCQGQYTGSISAMVSGGAAPVSIQWEGPQGFASADTLLIGLGAGAYVYTLTDAVGCIFTDTLQVLEPTGLLFDAEVHHVACFGDGSGSISLTLGGTTPGFDIFWTGPDGFTTVSPAIDDLFAGAYQASVTDTLGCISNFFFDILQPAALELNITSIGEALCEASSDGFVSAEILGGTAPYSISWADLAGAEVSTEISPAGLPSGVFEANVTDSLGCVVTQSVLIDFLLSPLVDAGADTVFCAGPDYVFAGLAIDAPGAYWADESGNVISDSLSFNLNLTAGQYQFIIHGGAGPCAVSDTLLITVLELPPVDAGQDYTLFPNQPVILGGGPTSDAENSLLWAPSVFLNDATLPNPTMTGQQGDLWYYVTATAPNGCTAVDSALVVVIPPVTVPSGFSPNGDGYNEVFQILDAEKYPSIRVDIFNRWGALLFTSQGYKTPWDGRHHDAPLPIGTYYYVIEINEPEFRDTLTGPVTIIR